MSGVMALVHALLSTSTSSQLYVRQSTELYCKSMPKAILIYIFVQYSIRDSVITVALHNFCYFQVFLTDFFLHD
jgi:hypothetical protein